MVAQYASTHKWLGARVGARVAGMRMGGPLWSPACLPWVPLRHSVPAP